MKILSVAALLLLFTAAHAEQVSTNPEATGSQCSALTGADFSGVQDAPTRVLDAARVAPAKGNVAYCLVSGYVAPQVGFELKLPESNWNGKLVTVGNAGWGGTVNGDACDRHVRGGYACVASDTGHRGNDGLWATGNLAAQVDFGFRSIHVATLAAKAIVNQYYSRKSSRSYFVGCSTGGYEGLVEAQRFPWDFDGIIAGAPDMDEADLTMREIWGSRNFLDRTGQPLFTSDDIKLLHNAVLAACDKDDGVVDGIISNPLACRFDPAKLLCKASQRSGCLTHEQVDAVRRIYAGPPIPGEPTQVRGVLPGSELNWGEGLASIGPSLGEGLFRHMIYGTTPEWTPANYDFSRDYKRLGMGALYTDTNPDLRKFKSAGGKLLVYQGWNDIVEMPTAITDYYETVEKTMGGRDATQQFFRLFMIPGMNHCGGGAGAYAIDYLRYLEAWVEQGTAPNALLGGHISDSYLEALPQGSERPVVDLSRPNEPPPSIPLTFTRPVYPYPSYAKYNGRGDSNDGRNFVPAE